MENNFKGKMNLEKKNKNDRVISETKWEYKRVQATSEEKEQYIFERKRNSK